MLDQIRSLCGLIYAMILLYMFTDCRFKNKRNVYLLGLFVTVVIICDAFVLKKFGYTYFMKLYPILCQLPGFLAFLFISKFNAIKVFFVNLTVIAISVSFPILALIILYLFHSDKSYLNYICFIMYLPAGLIIYRYFRPPFLYLLRNADKGWFGFCTIPFSYTALIYLTSLYNLNALVFDINALVSSILLIIMTFSAYILIFRFFKRTHEQFILQNEQNLLQTQVTAAHMHLEALKDSQEKTVIYRHDMRHHLALIGANLADNNRETAQKYIAELQENIEDTAVEKYCSNYTVNLILYYYITLAKNEEITVETQIDLPNKNAVSDMDLCVIFANALENAINACKCVPDKNQRNIKVVCKTKNDQLFIQITNSYSGTVRFVDDLPVAAKENHGLGIQSIAAVAKKYGGVYSFTAEKGVFTASIIL